MLAVFAGAQRHGPFPGVPEAINSNAERVSPDFQEVFTTLATNLRRRALLVFLTSLDVARPAETFEREVGLLARRAAGRGNRRGRPVLLFVEEPAGLDAVYQDLAGLTAWNRMASCR